MTCNLYRDSLSNMIGNVGEARHEQIGTGSERIAAPASAGGAAITTGSAPGRGRPSGLDDVQRRELMRALRSGALAEGFATDLWTLPRVGELIKRRFTRSYSESQVWRILISLGFSCQRPSGRALERDESAIKRWKQTRWPALKKTLQNKGGSSSSSTSPD